MTNEELFLAVAEIIREIFGVDDIEISRETVADDIPGWDSLSHTVLLATIEQALGVELTSTATFENVGGLIRLLSARLSAPMPAEERLTFPSGRIEGGGGSPAELSDELFRDLLNKDVEIPVGRFVYPCRLK